MQCYVYKSLLKADHFLYLPEEFDEANANKEIPSALISMLGELALVIEFDLEPTRTLANADAKQVIEDIEENGYYLQMPKETMNQWEEQFIN